MTRRLSSSGVFLAAVLLGMMSAYLIWRYLSALETRRTEHWTAVVVAVADIKPRTTIGRDMIAVTPFPREHIAADAITDIKQVEGCVAREHIKPKEQIRTSDLVPKGHVMDLSDEISPGMRAVTIGANEIIAVANTVMPGNHVDVLVSYHDPIIKREVTVPVLQDVRVLAVDKGVTQPADGHGASTSMTLEIPPEEGVLLAAADRSGALRVMLRGPSDTKIIAPDPTSPEDILGRRRREILEALSGLDTNRPAPSHKGSRVVTVSGTMEKEWALQQ
jgi:pilus assembly protein CpaB